MRLLEDPQALSEHVRLGGENGVPIATYTVGELAPGRQTAILKGLTL
jgi:hypothetical protein